MHFFIKKNAFFIRIGSLIVIVNRGKKGLEVMMDVLHNKIRKV